MLSQAQVDLWRQIAQLQNPLLDRGQRRQVRLHGRAHPGLQGRQALGCPRLDMAQSVVCILKLKESENYAAAEFISSPQIGPFWPQGYRPFMTPLPALAPSTHPCG